MQQQHRNSFFPFVVLVALLASMLGPRLVFAKGHNQQGTLTHISASGLPATGGIVSPTTVNMSSIPQALPEQGRQSSHREPLSANARRDGGSLKRETTERKDR
jgi:hypothetical protein